jgi:hypothetical protein
MLTGECDTDKKSSTSPLNLQQLPDGKHKHSKACVDVLELPLVGSRNDLSSLRIRQWASASGIFLKLPTGPLLNFLCFDINIS